VSAGDNENIIIGLDKHAFVVLDWKSKKIVKHNISSIYEINQ